MHSILNSRKRLLRKGITSGVLTICLLTPFAVSCAQQKQSLKKETFEIKIVHTNDIHAKIKEDEDSIGIERLSSIISTHKQGADIGLALDAGDLFHGQSVATLVKGESIATLANACGYDAMTSGNHDWNYNKNQLLNLEEIAELDILAGNVVNQDGSKFFDNEFLVKEVKKEGVSLKVGVMGMIDPDIYASTAPFNVEGLTYTNLEEYSSTASKKLRQEYDCDIVIALAHIREPETLAKKIDGVDVWLAGHDHISMNKSVTTPDGTTSYVVENGEYMSEVSLLSISCEIDEKGKISQFVFNKKVVNSENKTEYEKNAYVAKILTYIQTVTDVKLTEKVGICPENLTLPDEYDNLKEYIRTTPQTNLGVAVASAFLHTTGAEVAFENAGGIRATLAEGEVTYGDIISVSPYGNYLVTKQITGKNIRNILELSFDFQLRTKAVLDEGGTDPEFSGTSLQYAGMTVEYDENAAFGERVLSVKINDEEVADDRLITVALSNYLAISEDYSPFAMATELGQFGACEESLISFFQEDEDSILAAIKQETLIKR